MKNPIKIIVGSVALVMIVAVAVYYVTRDLERLADEFLIAVKHQDMKLANTYLADGFKATTKEADFKKFVELADLIYYKKSQWKKRAVSGNRAELRGDVETQNGNKVPIKVAFIKQGNDWKISAIQKPTAGFEDVPMLQEIPPVDEQIRLVQQTMSAFGSAIEARDMSLFRKFVSKKWQAQIPADKMEAAFSPMYGTAGLVNLVSVTPELEPVTKLSENGELGLNGFFLVGSHKVIFQHKYVYEDANWKVFGFKINFEEIK